MLNTKQMLSKIIWLNTPKEIRLKIASLFSVPRSSGMDVQGGRIVSDGYTDNDLAHITLEKLQDELQTESKDFYDLYDRLVKKINRQEEEITKPEIFKEIDRQIDEIIEKPLETLFPKQEYKPEVKKKMGRPKKVN